jgi:hypothetical protein
VLSYLSGMSVSNRALIVLADLLRQRRRQRGTRWRRLDAGRQALLVVAYLRKGEAYADLACGFAIGTTTVYRYVREALDLLAAMAPTLQQAMEVARGKAYVVLDGTLLRIDRVGMTGGRDTVVRPRSRLPNARRRSDPIKSRTTVSPATNWHTFPNRPHASNGQPHNRSLPSWSPVNQRAQSLRGSPTTVPTCPLATTRMTPAVQAPTKATTRRLRRLRP